MQASPSEPTAAVAPARHCAANPERACLAGSPGPLKHAGELQASPGERAAVAALETPRDAVRPAPKPKPGAGRARRRAARAVEQPAKPAVKPGRRQK